MVSKSQIKLITSLRQKKHRDKEGLFVAEGPKLISELREAGVKIHSIFSTKAIDDAPENFFLVSEVELQKLSSLKTANSSIAIFEIPDEKDIVSDGLVIALDAIRDPGNLGTIIRLCDWFGVTQIICSYDTADCYNPKVIQATMGSIARVDLKYVNLVDYLKNTSNPIYGGVLNGSNIYTSNLSKNAIVVMGNEANGICDEIYGLLNHKITIPQFGTSRKTESLNVATATAIFLSEFNRSTET